MLIVAFSGGKDSTAMALRLHEIGEPFKLLFTATGNELPPVYMHINAVISHTGAEMIRLPAPTLSELINEQDCLPNWRMRWCTRMIKIEPCIEYLKAGDYTLAVGLRADELERQGLYGDFAKYRYPLRDWEWDISQVKAYCASKGFTPPVRTDCAVCFYQTINEWYALWRNYPTYYAQGEAWEKQTGFTFRSPSRDTWPAALKDLRRSFEGGRMPRKPRRRKDTCRICSND